MFYLFSLKRWLRGGNAPRHAKKRQKSLPVHLEIEELEARRVPAITGTVFQDFNSNAQIDSTSTINNNGSGTIGVAQDIGVAGVTVTVTNAVLVGSTTTNAAGQYAIATPGPGTYQVEFTNIPAGFEPGPALLPENGTTANAGSTVQIVADGGTANLALVQPSQYAPNNPNLVTSIYYYGNPQATSGTNGQSANSPAVVSFPYSAGTAASDNAGSSDPSNIFANATNPTPTTLATDSQVGPVFGLAYNQQADEVYAGAFMKAHVGFGPGGPGAIYVMNATGSGTPGVFTTLNAGTDPQDTTDYFTDNFSTTWDAVGKVGLGGVALSTDGSTLYVVNLFDRNLYAISTANPANQTNVPIPGMPGSNITVPNSTGVNDLRPFAVTYEQGRVYIGMVNDAESTQNASDLWAYVYSAPVSGLTIGTFTLNLQVSLNYARPEAAAPGLPATWEPWQTTFAAKVEPSTAAGLTAYPTPWLTTITFDAQGNMVLGLRDRTGDQGGWHTPEDPSLDPNLSQNWFAFATGGDTLRAAINTPNNLASGWTLENNGAAGGVTTLGAGDGQGPGGGQFYYQQITMAYDHNAVAMGGVTQVPGFPDIATTAFDPIEFGSVDIGGVQWYNDTTGQLDKGYELYASPNSNGTTFGKDNGLGELVAIPAPAPIEIGDRVWDDTNGDGIQEAGEPGIAGVTVDLYQGSNPTPVATTTTDANGDYLFTNLLPHTTYTICLDNAGNFTGNGPLADFLPTLVRQGSDSQINSKGVAMSSTKTCISNYTTGGPGANDHTLDFGFEPTASLGDRVWLDSNGDGLQDNGETGINGVTVHLYLATDVNHTNPLQTKITAGDGNYLFTGLVPHTNYVVCLDNPADFATGGPLAGLIPTLALQGKNTATDSNGVPMIIGAHTVDCASAKTPGPGGSDLTYDFGFYQPTSLFGYVYVDAHKDNNRDPGDPSIPNVLVTISGTAYAGTPLAQPLTASLVPGGLTTRTDGNGFWSFPFLPPGMYKVVETQPVNYPDRGVQVADPSVTGIGLGTNVFSTINTASFPAVGALNFGEGFLVSAAVTKRFFLASSPTTQATDMAQLNASLAAARSASYVVTGTAGPDRVVLTGEGADITVSIFSGTNLLYRYLVPRH